VAVFLKTTPIPTGGAVSLLFNTGVSGTIALARATSGVGGISAYTTLYSGATLTESGKNQFFLDYGDGLPSPLVSGTTYVYQLTDTDSSTVQTGGVLTPSAFNLESDGITQILIRLLQAAVTNNVPPEGVKPARITQAMPLNGIVPLPMIVITPELLQQGDQKIGEDVELPDKNNIWTMSEFAEFLYRVSVLATTAVERDYYRDLMIAAFKIAQAYVFQFLGDNITHTYQAASYQVSDLPNNKLPGFYGCDVMLSMIGTFNLAIFTSYGLIETITATVSGTPYGTGGVSGIIEAIEITAQVPIP
jgi:hypothetical protein